MPGAARCAALVRQVIADPAQAAALAARGRPAPSRRERSCEIARAILAGDSAGVEHALADYELAVERRLDRTRILVRAGPALGLMGTLIPLAPGLAALGHGDVATLATDLRTAFAATTIGLLVGTVAFALTLTRTRMYTEDLTALERGAEAAGRSAASRAGAIADACRHRELDDRHTGSAATAASRTPPATRSTASSTCSTSASSSPSPS